MAGSAVVERSVTSETVSETVVYAVAEATGSDPESIEPLYHVVDTDALDTIFETKRVGPAGSPNRVAFTYCDCEVVVSADGTVQVSNRGREPAPRQVEGHS